MREQGWVSDEHFSVDGTLIEAWASLKSFVTKDQPHRDSDDDNPGNAEVNFRGQSAATPRMRARAIQKPGCARKAASQEAKLCFGLHALGRVFKIIFC